MVVLNSDSNGGEVITVEITKTNKLKYTLTCYGEHCSTFELNVTAKKMIDGLKQCLIDELGLL